ncbi:hypothetical protein B0H19DRAFT_1096298 [Mycena capillaripes]|nr:hypothetical protein B0H19DRAFT_1096298 [Mycena capillaripes]
MIDKAIYSAIFSLNHLEKLKFGTLDLPTTLHLARLPSLSCLHLQRFPSDSVASDFRAAVASTGPVFVELTTYSESIWPLIGFFDAIDQESLDTINLGVESSITTEEWQTLTTSLARKSPKTIRKLSLKEKFPFDHEIPDMLERMVSTNSTQPLPSCASLPEITVRTGHGIDLNDAFLKQMAQAWPQLQKLDLSPGCQSVQYVPQVTLSGLIPLAQHCPHMASLALVIDPTTTAPHSKNKPGGGISNRALVELEVVESPLSSPAAVASFLSAIFPNLQRVSDRDEKRRNAEMPDWEENMLNWASVSALVRVISSARAQEHRVLSRVNLYGLSY